MIDGTWMRFYETEFDADFLAGMADDQIYHMAAGDVFRENYDDIMENAEECNDWTGVSIKTANDTTTVKIQWYEVRD
jgi:hypothetical protein